MATIKQIKDTAGNVHDILSTIGYGTCATAAATAAKVATISDTSWTLKVGSIIGIKFTYSNTAGSTTTPVTLNVNSTGAKNIWYNNASYTGTSTSICGYANRVLFYMYDGTYWVWMNMGSLDGNSNTVPCIQIETAAATAAKAGTCTNYSLLAKSYAHANVRYSNTSKTALTLNVNSKGAKPIFINGTASSTSNYTLPAGTYIIYYDGTNYHFRTDGVLPNAPTVGNGKITIKQGGTEKGSFTVNQTGNTTIELTDNDSHNTSKNIVGSSSTATANAAVSSNGVYLNHLEQSSVTSSHKISGSGTVSVTSDSSGNITITGSNHTTPGNGTITIKQGGTEKGSFTVNQTGNTSIELTDNNTTYTFATGDSNGQIKVTPSGGSGTNISVKGLGSLAYKNSLSASDVGASASGHTHDDRYFTETEADGRYVKLNSGTSFQTIYSSGDTPLRVKNTTSTGSTYIGFFNGSDAFLGSIGVTSAKQINFYNGASNTVLHSGNYNDYAPSKTGTGASGSWGISITGNAATATNATNATYANYIRVEKRIGSSTKPVYFDSTGYPTACGFTVEKSVPSNAVFTDTVYTHPTTAGNKHIPSGGSSGQFLKYSASGTATWSTIDVSNVTDAVNRVDFEDYVNAASQDFANINGTNATGTWPISVSGTAANANNVKVNTTSSSDGLPILLTTAPSTYSSINGTNRAVYVDSTKSFYYAPSTNYVYAGGFFETSDERLKDIVKPISVDLDQLSKLRKVYFNWKDKQESAQQLGMIAQDVQEIYPELVSEMNGKLSLSYEKLSVVALEAIDVLHNENNELKLQNDELKNRIERLESIVNKLVEKN